MPGSHDPGLCLVTSRVWFPVFHGEYTGDWRAYPDQYYGMSLGLKMTTFSYVMMATASLAVGCILLWMIRRSPARAPAPRRSLSAERRARRRRRRRAAHRPRGRGSTPGPYAPRRRTLGGRP